VENTRIQKVRVRVDRGTAEGLDEQSPGDGDESE
jgi:hypothetical protein